MKALRVSHHPRSGQSLISLVGCAVIALFCVAGYAAAAVPATTTPSQGGPLHRVGPINANHGFPEWYQDSTGLAFEIGTALSAGELTAGLTLLLTGDVARTPEFYQYPPTTPPTFFDEHFYWHAETRADVTVPNGAATTVAKARFAVALEAAFLTGASQVPGSQVTFARTRILFDPAPYSGTYTLETPYKTYEITGVVAGQRIFFTDDYGVSMGVFTETLFGPVGPFLWPAETPGGTPKLPYSFEGRLYASDAVTESPVTGSPRRDNATGQYMNYVRLSCPIPGSPTGARWEWFRDTFIVTGRLKTGTLPENIRLQRAARYATPNEKRLDFFAQGSVTLPTRIPGPTAPASSTPVPAKLTVYPAPLVPVTLQTNGLLTGSGSFYGRWVAPAGTDLPTSVTAVDGSGFSTVVPVTDTVIVQKADYSLTTQTLTVTAQTADILTPTKLYVQGLDGVPAYSDPAAVPDVQTFAATKDFTLTAPPAYVTVASKGGGSATVPVSVGIPTLVSNTPPTASPITAKVTGTAQLAIDVTPYVNDADGDVLTVSAVTQPASGGSAVITSARVVTFTANAGFGGPSTFTYTISDGRGGSATSQITVDVNRPPTAGPVQIASSGVSTVIDVSASVGDPDSADVPNLTIISLGAVTPATNSSVSFSGKVITFAPDAGAVGVYTIPYTISDGRGGTASSLVTITVNRPPVAVNDSNSVVLPGSVTTLNVLANDTDGDGANATYGVPSLRITSVSPVSGSVGSFAPITDGKSLVFTAGSISGTGTYSYTIADGGGATASATFTVTVNVPPTALPVVATSNGTAITLNLAAVVTDPDDTTLTYAVGNVSPAGSGNLVSNGVASWTFTPSSTTSGVVTIPYTVSDGRGGTASSLVTVTINRPPSAIADVFLVQAGVNTTLNVLANDTDGDGTNATYGTPSLKVTSPAVGATVSVGTIGSVTNNAGALVFTAGNSAGSGSFTYTVTDGGGLTSTATVDVSVNLPPTAAAFATTSAGGLTAIDLSSVVGGAETGETLVVSAADTLVPANSANVQPVQNSRVVNFTPNATTSGDVTFRYTVSDGRGGTAFSPVTVNVNRPPVAVNDTFAVVLGTSSTLNVLANDTDADGTNVVNLVAGAYGPSSFRITSPAAGATVSVGTIGSVTNNNGSLVFTPTALGTATFSYTVSDRQGAGASSTATVTLSVTAANQPPIVQNLSVAGTIPARSATTISLTAGTANVDPEGGAISVNSVSGLAAAAGTVAISTDGKGAVYTPSLTASTGLGVQTFSYTLKDAQGLASTSATVTVTVRDVVTVSSARYQNARWSIQGTSGPGAVVTIRAGATATGTVITTVTADNTGAWRVSNLNSTVAATQITLVSNQRGSVTAAVQ